MIAKQQSRVAQLETLRGLIHKKEKEVSPQCHVPVPNFLIVYPQLRNLEQEEEAIQTSRA